MIGLLLLGLLGPGCVGSRRDFGDIVVTQTADSSSADGSSDDDVTTDQPTADTAPGDQDPPDAAPTDGAAVDLDRDVAPPIDVCPQGDCSLAWASFVNDAAASEIYTVNDCEFCREEFHSISSRSFRYQYTASKVVWFLYINAPYSYPLGTFPISVSIDSGIGISFSINSDSVIPKAYSGPYTVVEGTVSLTHNTFEPGERFAGSIDAVLASKDHPGTQITFHADFNAPYPSN